MHHNDSNIHDNVHHSKPIPISIQHGRHRSASLSSDSTSPASSPPLVTPNNFTNTRFPVPSTSPILHFLSQPSPTKSPATFPFRGFVPPPVFEDEPVEEPNVSTRHVRRASTTGRFQMQPPMLEPHHERGVNVLRRLSLSGYKSATDILQPTNPQPPPNTAVPSPINFVQDKPQPHRKTRRSTVSERPRRAPSPMGERILKGHFDGFN